MNNIKHITVSIVSHGQFKLLLPLLKDLKNCKSLKKIILTINIEEEILKPKWIKDLPIFWIYNKFAKGFGSNHNNAFKFCNTKYFCVLNPDIRLQKNVLDDLISLKEIEKINIIGPSIQNVNKVKSLNSRKFPGFFFLLTRIFMRPKKEYFYKENDNILLTDWIGGMFLIFSSIDYKKLKGFDTNYFLYFEDVDICKRANNIGFKVAQSKKIFAIHDAQRRSYSDILHLMYHLKSYFLYIKKYFLRF